MELSAAMGPAKVERNAFAYSAAIIAYERGRLRQRALDLLGAMGHAEVELYAASYSVAISACRNGRA
jgi:hypothetical protein